MINYTLMNRKLSIPAFIFSMLGILLVSLGGLLLLYKILNPQMKTNYMLGLPVTREPVSLILNLHSPDDDWLVFMPELLVSGKTLPKTMVLISLPQKDLMIEANILGDFSSTVTLNPGVSQISVAAFDNLGNSKIENRTVYYSLEKI